MLAHGLNLALDMPSIIVLYPRTGSGGYLGTRPPLRRNAPAARKMYKTALEARTRATVSDQWNHNILHGYHGGVVSERVE